MPAPTLPDSREEKDTNPIQRRYDENPGAGYVSSGQDQLEAFANDPRNSTAKSLNDAESQASGAVKTEENIRDDENAPGGWKNNTNNTSKKVKSNRFMTFVKKRGGLFGILAALGVGGGLLASLLAPASVIINLMENATIRNDSSSTVLEKRVLKVLGHMTQPEDPICANRTNSLKCKMGRISNSAITKLENKGVKAIFADSVDNNERKKTGYPTKNPTHYEFDIDGTKTTVEASKLVATLRDNPKMAAKVLGVGGAINVKLSNYSGRHFAQQMLKKFGINKNGGLADGKNGKLSAKERYKAAIEKMHSKIPGKERFDTVERLVNEKVGKQLGKAQKGGAAYVALVGGCIGVKAPAYVASAIAAVQLAQVMPFAMDLVLSPGSKAKASGVDPENSVTGEDMDTIGTILNEKTPRESDGKMSAAMDSQYLQSNVGVNTGKPPVSEEYTPGYSALTSDLVVASQQAAQDTEAACNVILSPAAMWSAFAVDSAVTVATSATIVGGVIKVIGSIAIGKITEEAVKAVAGDVAKNVALEVATNNKIPTAQGEALGDVTGIALSSFFSASAASRHIPVMKTSQIASFKQTALENENFHKEMDIASLSPFDISSQYTFLGSIVNSVKLAVVGNTMYNGSFSSILSSVAQLPSLSFSSKVGAADYNDNNCTYAEQFRLSAEGDTPAITMAGTPCYFMTDQQLQMETGQALSLVEEAGWFDESVVIDDSYNINDMMGGDLRDQPRYIKPDTPMAEFVDSCGDLSTGDYIFNAAGCTVGSSSEQSLENGCYAGPDGNDVCTGSGEGASNPTITPASTEALSAVSVSLVDFQLSQMVNDTDTGNGPNKSASGGSTGGEGGANTGRPEGAVDEKAGWTFAPGKDYSATPCDPRTTEYSASHRIRPNSSNSPATGAIIRLCQLPKPFESGGSGNGANLVASVISSNVMNMLTAARNEGKMINLYDGFRMDFNGGYVSQHTTGLSMDLAVDGANTICREGANSRNGWGSAENAERQCKNIGDPEYAAYKWLQANAAKYGFHNYEVEPWHWSTSGK